MLGWVHLFSISELVYFYIVSRKVLDVKQEASKPLDCGTREHRFIWKNTNNGDNSDVGLLKYYTELSNAHKWL